MVWMRTGLLVFVFLIVQSAQADGSYIWWEGEDAVSTNFPSNSWFANGAVNGKRDLLSNGAWLCNDGNRTGDEAFATYKIDIPEAGEYDFWVRKFWKHGPFKYRFGDGDWNTIGSDISLADSVEIQQFLSVNWVYGGAVTLPEGETTSELRLLAGVGQSLTACFDCFLLTPSIFVPRGKLKPDERSGMADDGFFAWEPAVDDFTSEAALDLRSLNEPYAGINGFVKTDEGDFILGNGEPVRFWAVNASSGIAGLDHKSVKYLARLLAKRGVNMVRYHSPLFNSNNVDKVDAQKLDDLFYFVNALKQQGIYTEISFYFPLWFDVKSSYGISGYESINNKKPFALLYFNQRMQEIYKNWAKDIFTTPSPYSGVPLANDPAVAIVEIINEDSFFFWTFTKQNVPSVQWAALEILFGDWLKTQYGSLDAARAAWSNLRESGDDFANGRVALYEAWNMTGDAIRQANAARKKRVGDQVRFLTETQRGFYQETVRYFHEDLGIQSLVSPSNWTVSDPAMLDALERYTYTAGAVIDKHGYFNGGHTSPDGSDSYSVTVGHTFTNRSAVKNPANLPLQFIQLENHPQIISEIGWTNPNLYRADFDFLMAAYGSLQDVDGFFTFALGGASWDSSMGKFAASCPAILGNFPAYALMYRRGDVQKGSTVLRQVLKLDDLYAMKGNGGAESQNFDGLRLEDVPPGGVATGEVSAIDPLSYYVGRVTRTFGDNPSDSTETNLEPYIDRSKQTVTSETGELNWNYGAGLATIDTPNAQGCTGFLGQAGTVDLSGVRVEMKNEYGSIVAISLDGEPLAESETILIQAMTVERPYGFRADGGKEGKITNMGGYPFGVELIDAVVTLKGAKCDSVEVIALDENGYPTEKEVRSDRDSGGVTIHLAPDAAYHVIKRSCKQAISNWSLCRN
ncbi:MAG: hypothetical protein GC154_00655 [bacterium]|nr:hypothetical protein [bacterium]